MTISRHLMILCALLALTACGSSSSTSPSTSSGVFTTTDLVVGAGTTAASGSRVTVTYAGGWLYDTSKSDGKGSSFDPGGGFTFIIGSGQLIKGFEQGVIGMKVGGQRRVIIPPDLAYGNNPPTSTIPKNATLVFDITLLSIG